MGTSATCCVVGTSSFTGVIALSVHSFRILNKFKQAGRQSENPNLKLGGVFLVSAPKPKKGAGVKGREFLLLYKSQCGMRQSHEAKAIGEGKKERRKGKEESG